MIGIVLAGGASRRFGEQPKGLLLLAGRPMALRVTDMLSKFCTHVVVEAARGAGYEALGLPLCHAPAEHAGKGPLAGLAAGLVHAGEGAQVAFAPCDMPFLDASVYQRLVGACADAPGAYAATAAGVEPLVAILRSSVSRTLLEALSGAPLPRTHAVLDGASARAVSFDDRRLFENVNTPEDLARLESRLSPAR